MSTPGLTCYCVQSLANPCELRPSLRRETTCQVRYSLISPVNELDVNEPITSLGQLNCLLARCQVTITLQSCYLTFGNCLSVFPYRGEQRARCDTV